MVGIDPGVLLCISGVVDVSAFIISLITLDLSLAAVVWRRMWHTSTAIQTTIHSANHDMVVVLSLRAFCFSHSAAHSLASSKLRLMSWMFVMW